MIRPCDTCNGCGEVPGVKGEGEVKAWMPCPCPSCVDMPQLKAKHATGSGNNPLWMRGWFKPDPSTIIRWCQEHGSVQPGEACEFVGLLWWTSDHGQNTADPGLCRPVWVAVPEPLEEA